MIAKLAALDPDNAQIVEFASAVLGRDLRAHFRADIGRRWLARPRFATDSAEGFRGHLASVVQDLRDASRGVAVAG